MQQRRIEAKAGAIIAVPLLFRDEVLGTMTAVNRVDEPDFTPQDVELMTAIANQAAIAIENAHLFEEMKEARQLSDTLREIEASLTATLDIEKVLNHILDGLGKVVPYASVSLMLIEDNVLRIKAARGLPDDSPVWSYPFVIGEEGIVHEIYKTKKPLIIPDVHQDPDFVQMKGSEHIRGWLGVPLIARDQVTGILNIDHNQPGFYTEKYATIATAFAHQAAIALENARLFDETQQRAEHLETLRQTSLSLTSSLELQPLLETILNSALHLLAGADNAHIFLYQNDHLTYNSALWKDGRREKIFNEPRPQGLTYTVARRGEAIIVPDMRTHPLFTNASFKLQGAIIGLPLKISRRVVGVMNIASLQPQTWLETELHALELLADQAAIAIENARLFEAERVAREQAETLREDARQNLDLIMRLYELSAEFVSILSLEDVANLVIKKVLQATGARLAALFLLDETGSFEQAFGPPKLPPRSSGATMTIAKTGQPFIVNDIQQSSYLMPESLVAKGIKAFIGLPLKAGEQTIGVLFVNYAQPHNFSDREIETFFIFANQAAIAIQNARLYEKVQQHTAQLEARVAERTFKLQTLYELAYKLGHTTQLSEVLRLTLLELYQTLPHDVAASLLLTDTRHILVIQSQHALTPDIETQIRERLLNTIASPNDHAINEKNLEVHRLQPSTEDNLQPPLKTLDSMMTVPILAGEMGVGLLLVATEQAAQFNLEQKRLLYIVANQAADTISRLQSLLAAEHQRLENLVAHLPNGIIMLNAEHQVVLANPLAQKLMHGLTTAQVGNRLTQLGEYSIETILNPISTDGPPLTLVPKNLPSQLLEVVANPITTGVETGGWILLLRDVTEERGIQRRIQQQERMAAVGQLAAGIAHDFNNILTSVIGYAELLLLDPSLSPSAKDDVARITKQGQRAAHLVRQILDFSRQTISAKHSLNLLPVVQETIKLLERTIREDIHISLEAEPGDYAILGDLTQIQQALTNLAVNARDAMPVGGNLKFQLSRLVLHSGEESPDSELYPGDWIVLAISDTGIGIAPELHQQIFEPFFTTKEVGEGTGLGLAQVYGIMTQHDGYIGVKSQARVGTTFNLYFPALLAAEPSSQETTLELPRGNNELILLVEDDLGVLTITTTMLEHLGYRVLTATNGHEALEMYDKHQSDITLVLTDMTMPQMGGAELTAALRKRNPAVKVVILTGYPQEEIGKPELTQGVVDWLHKPLSVENLAHTISRSLRLQEETS